MHTRVQEFKKQRGIPDSQSWFDKLVCQPERPSSLYSGDLDDEEVKQRFLIPRFKIVDFGSTRLGVESVKSDIDILITTFDCFFDRLQFFQRLEAKMKSERGVENFVILKNAHIPLVDFTYNGVCVDIVFADMITPPQLLRGVQECGSLAQYPFTLHKEYLLHEESVHQGNLKS